MPVYSVRRVLTASLAVSLAATVAQPASAQTRSWDNYCTNGSLHLCFSIDISVALVPNPGYRDDLALQEGSIVTILRIASERSEIRAL